MRFGLAMLGLAALTLSGCATGPTFAERMAALMGSTEVEVIREIGVPDADVTVGEDDARFLRWSFQDQSVYPSTPYGWRGSFGGYPVVVSERCDLEIEFQRSLNGIGPWRAESWRTRGPDC